MKCCNVELKPVLLEFIGMIVVVNKIFLNVNSTTTQLLLRSFIPLKGSWCNCFSTARFEQVNVESPQQIFVLMKTSSRRLGQGQYIRLGYILASRRLQDVFKTSSRRLQDVLPRRLQDVFNTSSRRLANRSSRRLQDVLKTSSKRLQDIFKTSSRCIIKLNCSC